MPDTFDAIIVIYNPISTNNAIAKAEAFRDNAKAKGITVEMYPTNHAGHAAEMATEIVAQYNHPLIVSVSGDGGYNELINGVMLAKKDTNKTPVVAIIGAGNANDHKRTTRDAPLTELILAHDVKPLDLLHIKTKAIDRFAHSYIGLGITPEVAVELNQHKLNRFLEALIVVRSFARFKPFTIVHDGEEHLYSSLLFANIPAMAKIVKLDTEQNELNDGKFEIISFDYHGKLHLLWELLRSVIFGNAKSPQAQTYTFTTTNVTPVQLDGEIETLHENTQVTVTAVKDAIYSLY